MNSPLITVDEAAARTGRSPATLRRWAASGRVRAHKVGKQWLLEPASLPGPRRRASPSTVWVDADLETSLQQLRKVDFKEVWVPDILRFEDAIGDAEIILAGAAQRLQRQGPFDAAEEIDVPKAPFFARSGHSLSLEDRVAYHSAVRSLMPRIEARRQDCVFSGRMARDPERLLEDGRDMWLLWRKRVREQAARGFKWMIKTDITSYFDSVSHALLFPEIDRLDPHPAIAGSLKRMLSQWATVRGQGLPQGPDASRALGNFFLFPVDQVMDQSRWKYLRYMDDLRILTMTRGDAVRAVRLLDRECKRRGLFLSAQKTELLTEGEIEEELAETSLDRAHYFFGAGRYRRAGKLLREILKQSVGTTSLDKRKATFSLWRLHRMRDRFAVPTLIDHLESFAPVADIVATFMRPHLLKKRTAVALGEFLLDDDRNTSPFLSAWLLAAIIDAGRTPVEPCLVYAATAARDRNRPLYERILAASVLSMGGRTADILWIEDELIREVNPLMARGFLVALFRQGPVPKSILYDVRRRHPQLERTIGFLQGRQKLPLLTTFQG